MNTMNKFFVGLLTLALALGGYSAFFKESKVTIINPETGEKVGAMVSPYSPLPNLNLGGVDLVGNSETLQTGSSTVCAIQSPTSTSTLISAGIRFSLASTSAVGVDLAKGTTQFATTTRIGTLYSVAASAQATIVASTTGSVAGDATIFAPNQFFVARFSDHSGSSGAGNAPTGYCYAVWARLQ